MTAPTSKTRLCCQSSMLRRTVREFETGNPGHPVLILQSIIYEIFGGKPERAIIHGIQGDTGIVSPAVASVCPIGIGNLRAGTGNDGALRLHLIQRVVPSPARVSNAGILGGTGGVVAEKHVSLFVLRYRSHPTVGGVIRSW